MILHHYLEVVVLDDSQLRTTMLLMTMLVHCLCPPQLRYSLLWWCSIQSFPWLNRCHEQT